MRAVRIEAPGIIGLVELAKPEPQPGEIRIALSHVGYCGSDLSSFEGRNPMVAFPRVPGHELSGRIDRIGPHVPSSFALGQPVTIFPYFNCGQCFACRNGMANACIANQTMGVQREGALSEYVCVPHEHAIAADGLDARAIALIEPLAISFHALGRAQMKPGQWVAVLGVGMIGLGIVLGAVALGAKVIAVDVAERKLDLARALGATHGVLAADPQLVQTLRDLTDGDGPSVIFEAAGGARTANVAIEAASQTAQIVLVGYTKQASEFETRMFVAKELTIRGSRGATREDFAAAASFLKSHPDVVGKIVTRTVSLNDAADAMRDWAADPAAITKIMIEV